MTINPLNISDTFQTWFNKTNTIISEINGITVHNILAGDGIGITSSGNIFTINHGSNVATGVTFTGAVKFTNTVSFSSSPSIDSLIVNVSPKSSGITIGNVVRITGTGLTLAKADTAENAEVLGIVVGGDSTSHTVATAGSINNKNFSTTIPNLLGSAGATLNVGCAYFLSPTVAGGITTIEPVTYGQVSKPLVLGISGDVGSILLHRGIQIEGISAGITAELDNKIIIEVDASVSRDSTQNLYDDTTTAPGSIVILFDEGLSNDLLGEILLNTGPGLISGNINGSSQNRCVILSGDILFGQQVLNQYPDVLLSDRIFGMVSKVISKNSTTKKIILEVTLPGGSFNSKISELDPLMFPASMVSKTGSFWLDTSTYTFVSDPAQATPPRINYSKKFLDFIRMNDADNTAKIIFHNNIKYDSGSGSVSTFAGGFSVVSGGLTGSLEYDNLVPNGGLSIWQRPWSNMNGITFTGLSAYNTPIADRWFYMASSTDLAGLSLHAVRQTFDPDQIIVPGSPEYWLDLTQKYTSVTGLNYRPRLENIQRGAKLLQGQEATITFWAMAGVCGATMDIVYNRYPENNTYATVNDASDTMAAREVIASGVELGTIWDQYSYTFTPTQQTVVTGSEQGWFGVGFEFPSSGVTLSIAQVKLELGTDVADYVYTRPEVEINRCSPYYLRTYDWDQATGFTGTSRLNEQYLTLGNLLSQKTYDVKFTTQLVDTPNVILYSPTGVANEAFNVTKNADMRFPRCEGCPIHVNLPWDTSTVRTSLSSGNITVTNTTKNGMQVTINNGATHLDTLKFHYVADADLKIKV